MYIQVFLVLLITLQASLSWAEHNFSVSGAILYFDYQEFSDTGTSLNHETGFIPGINLNYSKKNNNLGFIVYSGTIDYDGQTQSGSPHQTDTDETLYIFTYRQLFPFNDGLDKNNYYAEINYQFWERDIQPINNVNGLYEEYSWWSIEAGIQTRIYQNENRAIKLELGMLHTFNGFISIDLRNTGYGEPELSLENKPGIRTKLSFHNKLSEQQTIYFSCEYKHWKFGRSDSQTLSNGFSNITVTEPSSQSNHTSISLGLISHF